MLVIHIDVAYADHKTVHTNTTYTKYRNPSLAFVVLVICGCACAFMCHVSFMIYDFYFEVQMCEA